MSTNGAMSKGTIYCLAGGTRGDQQPLVFTAKRLQGMGYNIVLCIGPEGKDWVEQYGFGMIEFESAEKAVNENPALKVAAETGDFAAFGEALVASVSEDLPRVITTVYNAVKSDASAVGMVCTSTHWWVATVLQRKLGIYGSCIFMSPLCPTSDFAPYMIDIRDPRTWQALGPPFDKMDSPPAAAYMDLWMGLLKGMTASALHNYRQSVQLCEAGDVFKFDTEEEEIEFWLEQVTHGEKAESNALFAYSPLFVENGPSDYTQNQKDAQLNFVFDANTDTSNTSMSPFDENLKAFVRIGEPPIYFGWGSMSREKNDDLVRAAIGACKRLGKRGVVLGGWAHLNLDMLDDEKDADLIAYANAGNIYFTKKANHIHLLPECACAVVHGGIGTTACVLRSGKPGIITPCWWDQNFCGDRLEKLGVGRRGPHFSQLNADNLSRLLEDVLNDGKCARNCFNMRQALLKEEPGDAKMARNIDEGIMKGQPLLRKLPSLLRQGTLQEQKARTAREMSGKLDHKFAASGLDSSHVAKPPGRQLAGWSAGQLVGCWSAGRLGCSTGLLVCWSAGSLTGGCFKGLISCMCGS